MDTMSVWEIRPAQQSDRHEIARMMALLWPDKTQEEHLEEVDERLRTGSSGTLPLAVLVAEAADGRVAGFIEVDLRSHADGCDPARPVGYIEGWFVDEEFRQRGAGREMVRAAEEWARGLGCIEMASDTWIVNEGSQSAHLALGFEIVDRCVHFRKSL